MARSSLAPLWRLLSRVGLAACLLSVLGGSFTCSWRSHHDDDHDKEDDDDEQSEQAQVATLAPMTVRRDAALRDRGDDQAGASVFVLDDYRLLDAAVQFGGRGEATVRRVTDIRGLSLGRAFGDGPWSLPMFEAFAQRVREANPAWLALPARAGALLPTPAGLVDARVLVRWVQVLHAADPAQAALPVDGLVFAFDPLGDLLQIENDVRVPGS